MTFCRKSLKIVLFGHNDPNTKISAIEIAIQIVPYIIKNIRLLMKALKLVPLLIVCIFCFGNICFQMEGQFSRLRSLKEFTPLMFRSSYWEWDFLLIAGCCKIKLQTQRVQTAEVCSQGSWTTEGIAYLLPLHRVQRSGFKSSFLRDDFATLKHYINIYH